jgi:hypothetical protein
MLEAVLASKSRRIEGGAMPDLPPSRGSKRLERAFTLRVWREAGGAETAPLRGSLVELGEGRRFYFTQLQDLEDFLKLIFEEGD